ncbi:MAG: DUF1987 domain-containing protein [Ekhidna sp.]|uniref:DUF1987 domain-containing protein n=1 Tax=Ekhidna sp. TaxID=2608089 RepID=UPI0032EB491E
MEEVFITESTRTTPYTCVNYSNGKVDVKGRSSPENTMEFYDPFIKAIALLKETGQPKIEANFRLIYFNTSSARCIYLIIRELKTLEEHGKKVTINWFAEEDDEDMVETGLDFQDIVDIDINITKTSGEY